MRTGTWLLYPVMAVSKCGRVTDYLMQIPLHYLLRREHLWQRMNDLSTERCSRRFGSLSGDVNLGVPVLLFVASRFRMNGEMK